MNQAVARTIGAQLVRQSLNESGFALAELALTQLRVDAGLSIQQLADLSGLSYTAIRATEHALYPPTRKHVDAVCQCLGRVGLLVSVVGAGLEREVWIRVAQPETHETTNTHTE